MRHYTSHMLLLLTNWALLLLFLLKSSFRTCFLLFEDNQNQLKYRKITNPCMTLLIFAKKCLLIFYGLITRGFSNSTFPSFVSQWCWGQLLPEEAANEIQNLLTPLSLLPVLDIWQVGLYLGEPESLTLLSFHEAWGYGSSLGEG